MNRIIEALQMLAVIVAGLLSGQQLVIDYLRKESCDHHTNQRSSSESMWCDRVSITGQLARYLGATNKHANCSFTYERSGCDALVAFVQLEHSAGTK